jgi:hypothetical protein
MLPQKPNEIEERARVKNFYFKEDNGRNRRMKEGENNGVQRDLKKRVTSACVIGRGWEAGNGGVSRYPL